MAVASPRKYVLAAAIDFGTTFSGYAFSFKSSKENPNLHEQMRLNKDWGAGLGLQSFKTPTTVLTNRAGDFLAFGYEAEQQYQDALQDSSDKANDMLLFRHFKMMLHNERAVRRNTKIVSVDSTIGPALPVFANAIRYLKNHLLDALGKELAKKPTEEDIRWVITVPAIWGDESKQFMREAAFKAGCTDDRESDQLVIALEPEAASVCCRRLSIAQYANNTGISFAEGTKYLVLDCGGGTVDITAHITDTDDRVNELAPPSGGPWGGTEVDKNFLHFLSKIFGTNFINEYQKEAPREWLSMVSSFEKIKKAFKPNGKSKLSLPVLWNMQKLYRKLNDGKEIDDRISQMSANGIDFVAGNMVIDHVTSMGLFEPVVTEIIQHVTLLLTNRTLRGMKYIFMVGGFSECAVLQQAMMDAFSGNGLKVLIPHQPQLAIVQGAVLFGHKPTEITRRIAKHTYGSAVSAPFNPKIHDPMYKVIDSMGRVRCDDVLNVYVEKGEEIKQGTKRHFSIYASPHSEEETISILRLDDKPQKPVQYINVPGMTEVGKITLKTPPSAKRREMNVELILGGTEILVEAEFTATGEKVSTSINFLHG